MAKKPTMRKVTTPADLNSIGIWPCPAADHLAPHSIDTLPPHPDGTSRAALLAEKLMTRPGDIPPEQVPEREAARDLEKIIAILYARSGNDFSLYHSSLLLRRIARRMGLHHAGSVSDYARNLGTNPQEADLLFKEMLIGVTGFFRDPAVWDYLLEQALPALLAAYPDGKELRAWVPACSTGEEAFSLAIAFKETLERVKPEGRFSLEIIATDLDTDAIDKATRGLFSGPIAGDVSPERLRRFFVADGGNYRVSNEIRDMIVFGRQNIAMDPPLAKLDIITCRNLLIYFGPDLQRRLIPMFHHALNRDGLLLLGLAETIGGFMALFSMLDSRAPLYRRIESASGLAASLPVESPRTSGALPAVSKDAEPQFNLRLQADRFLLRNFTPAAALVNQDGDILYLNGCTEKYLEPAAGKSNWNVHAMARDGLRHALAIALNKAMWQQTAVTVTDLAVMQNGGAVQMASFTIMAIDEPGVPGTLLMIVFGDIATPESGTNAGLHDQTGRTQPTSAHDDIPMMHSGRAREGTTDGI